MSLHMSRNASLRATWRSCVCTVVALCGPTRLLAQPTESAAMFRGSPAHSGVYASSVTPTLSATAWTFQTNGRVFSSPAVANGVVVFGSTDQQVYAVGARDGALRWKFTTQGPVTSSPAIVGDLAYVASLDGRVYAIDMATGAKRWSFATRGERRFTAPGIHGIQPRTELMPDPYDMFISSPVVSNGRVYIGSGDGGVYALDAATGALVWRFATGNVVHATPAIADGIVYIGSWDRNFYALDATTGQKQWAYETGQDTVIYNQVGIVSSAAISGDVVLFGGRDGFFYALDRRSGTLRWRHDNNHGWVIASPAVRNGVVYFPTSDGTRFKALDVTTGTRVFDVANKTVSFSSPAVVNQAVFYGTSDGWLHAIDASSGATLAEFQTDGSRANANRYIGPDGRMRGDALYPDRTHSGIVIGLDRMFSLGAIISSPVVVDGLLFVGSTDGKVYALR